MPKWPIPAAAAARIEPLLKWNTIIAIAIGVMLRASLEFSEAGSGRPDGLFVMLFFAAMTVAFFAILRLKHAIGTLGRRSRRIVVAVVSLTGQLILLQLLVDRFAP